MFVSLARQLVALVPAAWLLARLTGDVTAVWWSFPIAELVSISLSVSLFVLVYRTRIRPLGSAPSVAEAVGTV